MIEANDPSLKSWINVKADSDFPIQNLPFGVFKEGNNLPRVGSIVGEKVIDLHALMELGYLDNLNLPQGIFEQSELNPFIALGKSITNTVRNKLSEIFCDDNPLLRDNPKDQEHILHQEGSVSMLMPIKVGDYTDFYSSEQHAYNVGCMFRNPENALLPNWKHLPVGYHGRASSIVVSGTPIHRPKGQMMKRGAVSPEFGPTQKLDFELEMAFITGKSTTLGESITTGNAKDFIFGFTLFNDWSARDVQGWEYVPLGPFLGKNFASAVSPWVVTLEALEPFKVPGPKQDPPVLDYLAYSGDSHYDINLEVFLKPEGEPESKLAGSNYKYLYWNILQQLAHQTVNGCNINVGDLYASGTISGPTPDSYGSLLELSWNGTKALRLSNGEDRFFIEDGDSVILRGYGVRNGVRLGFGEVTNKILKSK